MMLLHLRKFNVVTFVITIQQIFLRPQIYEKKVSDELI